MISIKPKVKILKNIFAGTDAGITREKLTSISII